MNNTYREVHGHWKRNRYINSIYHIVFSHDTLMRVVHLGMQALGEDLMRNGLSALQKVYTHQRAEILNILEEESLLLSTAVNEIQDKLTQICINAEIIVNPVGEMECFDSSCKDVHVTMDIGLDTIRKVCLEHNELFEVLHLC